MFSFFLFSTSPSNEDTLNHFQIDRNFVTTSKENVASSIDSDQRVAPGTPGDKLHRVRPMEYNHKNMLEILEKSSCCSTRNSNV